MFVHFKLCFDHINCDNKNIVIDLKNFDYPKIGLFPNFYFVLKRNRTVVLNLTYSGRFLTFCVKRDFVS